MNCRQTAQQNSGRASETCWSVQCVTTCSDLPSCNASTDTVCVATVGLAWAATRVPSVETRWRVHATLWPRSCANRSGIHVDTVAARRASFCATWTLTKPLASSASILVHSLLPGDQMALWGCACGPCLGVRHCATLSSSMAPRYGTDGNITSSITALQVFPKDFTSFLLMKNCSSGVVSTGRQNKSFLALWDLRDLLPKHHSTDTFSKFPSVLEGRRWKCHVLSSLQVSRICSGMKVVVWY